ncbi:ABC transporter permease [Flavitalea flava]
MFTNYLKIAIRNLFRNRLFTGLNIFGLATGMACSILIFLWVQDELSYDRFNANSGQIYRMTTRLSGVDAAVVPVPIAMAVKTQIPVIKRVTRLAALHGMVTAANRKFDEKNMYYSDSNFLRIFSYPLIKGDPATLLSQPGVVVLTEKAAKKYFGGTENAMGKTIHVDNDIKGNDLIVNGILKDIPRNSHLQFDLLLPISLYERTINQSETWGNYDVYTYLQFDDHFSATPAVLGTVEQQINDVRQKNDNTKTRGVFFLQSLTDIHLHSHLLLDVDGQGNNQYVRIFSLVALFILLIACINFMNLSTALSGRRAKEVGLRKTVGALRGQLILQFISESVLLSFISLIIGGVLAVLLLPLFNDLASKSISISLLNVRIIGELLGTAVLVGLISGSYPALFLSSFNPVKVLKGVKVLHGGKSFFRNGLVVIQFSISVILMVSTLVVYNQLRFIRTRDIGFNKENLLYVPMPQVGDLVNNYQAVRSEIKQNPALSDFTIVSHLPTYLTTGTTSVNWTGKNPGDQIIFPQLWIDDNFIKTFGMNLATGRTFSNDFKADENNFVVNETALRTMKMNQSNAIGQTISVNERTGKIIGVVKDFNFKPVQQPVEPLILKNGSSGHLSGNAGFVVIRTSTARVQDNITQVKKVFQTVYPDLPFSYGFLNEDLSKLYVAEQRMGKLFNVFSVLSILVSSLGLFGLATFATQKRVREIGVRKVLGASEAGIVTLLSKDFIKLVLMSLVIAFPLAWWSMSKWLENFVYHIRISWWMFALAGAIAIVIAFFTVGYQSVKAAIANPVKSLRTE